MKKKLGLAANWSGWALATVLASTAMAHASPSADVVSLSAERVVASRSASDDAFDRELIRLADAARSDSSGHIRVLAGVALPADAHSSAAARSRSATAEQKYQEAVARRQAQLITALGHRFQQTDLGVVNIVNGLPYVSLYLSGDDVLRLKDNPFVESVAEEGRATDFLLDTIPQVDANDSHALGYQGFGRAVAVVDGGAQTNHPFFGTRVVSGACYSTSDPGLSSICAGGAPSGSTTLASGGPCNYTGDPGLGCGHGTHVAGIAMGSTTGRTGVAPAGKLITIQASSQTNSLCPPTDPAPCRRYLESDVANALMRVHALRYTYQIASVNLSLGFSGPLSSVDCGSSWPLIRDAIDTLYYDNIPVVVASGNLGKTSGIINDNNKMPSPACITRTISVGAVTKADTFATYTSANNALLDLLAPGGSGTGADLTQVSSSIPGSTYGLTAGTSQAAPHVAGAIALMRPIFPYASPTAIQRQLRDTGPLVTVSYPSPSGQMNYTKRRLETDAAMANLPAAPAGSVAPVGVANDQCYGSNSVTWTPLAGTDEYHLEGSSFSNFSSPSLLTVVDGSASGVAIEVTSTRYVRVRACEGVSCGAWQAAPTPATYFNGCP